MPPIAQRTVPQEGFTVYDSDDQVAALLERAGFTPPEVRVFGDPGHPAGRLALATPGPCRQPGVAGRRTARALAQSLVPEPHAAGAASEDTKRATR
jgi:hypothetical protein